MGGSHGNPFRQGGELLSQYIITGKNQELFITYLTQKKNNKDYLLRELTFTEQRQLILNCQKLKNRKSIKSQHLTLLQSKYSRMQKQRKGRKIICVHIITKFILFGNTPINLSSRRLRKEICRRNPFRIERCGLFWLVLLWVWQLFSRKI